MKQQGVFLIGLILISIYYFLFPRSSGRELILTPDSLSSLEFPNSTVPPAPGNTLAVRSGHRAGFINTDHELISLYSSGRLAVDSNWIAVSDNGGLDLMEPDGRLISRIPDSAYPVSRNGNLYLYRDSIGTLSKIDPLSGRKFWSREYISPVTVLDGRRGRTLVGLLDGRAELIDEAGKVLLDYRPGGSRVEAVYGGVLSEDGSRIALISGLDPQRFILLEERKNGFRPVTHHETLTDFRRSIPIGFIRDAGRVIYESDVFASVVDINSFDVKAMQMPGSLVDWIDNPVSGTLMLLGRDEGRVSLSLLSRHDLEIFRSSLPPDTIGIFSDRNYFLIVSGNNFGVMEFSVQ